MGVREAFFLIAKPNYGSSYGRVWLGWLVQQNSFSVKKNTPWPESASELYRPSDRSFSAKLVPTFVDRGCHVDDVTDPYGRILGFLHRYSP
jgi:hypothetical protein